MAASHCLNERGAAAFIHYFSNESKGCSYERVINHGLSESFKAADSFTNETPLYVALRRTPDVADFVGTIISLQNITNNIDIVFKM